MNVKAQVAPLDSPESVRKTEKESVSERKTGTESDSRVILVAGDSTKIENRFARLKRHLRKRSASIL